MLSNAEYTPTITLDGESIQLSIREFARATAKAMSSEGVLDDYVQSSTEAKIQWATQNIEKVAEHVDLRSWQERLLDSWITSLSEWRLFYKARRLEKKKLLLEVKNEQTSRSHCRASECRKIYAF